MEVGQAELSAYNVGSFTLGVEMNFVAKLTQHAIFMLLFFSSVSSSVRCGLFYQPAKPSPRDRLVSS